MCYLQGPAVTEESEVFAATVHIDLSSLSNLPVLVADGIWTQVGVMCSELAVKWTLNAISTGAHIMKGKVCSNIMIDLKVRYVLSELEMFA